MLVDDVITAASKPNFGPAGRKLVGLLHEAHRFDLSTPFTEACDTVARLNPVAIEKVHDLFRLPYETTWMEVRQDDREVSRSGRMLPMTIAGVDRVGVLMRRLEGSPETTIHLFWNFRKGPVRTSVVRQSFDAVSGSDLTEREVREIALERKPGLKGMDLDAQVRTDLRFSVSWSEFRKHEVDHMLGRPDRDRQMDTLTQMAHSDWAGERRFWIAAVALLASRNVATTRRVDPEPSANRMRSLRNKLPLLSYTICDVAARMRSADPDGSPSGPGATRAHFVRGHFKLRSSGLYWWSPFIRGDTSLGFVDKSYRIV